MVENSKNSIFISSEIHKTEMYGNMSYFDRQKARKNAPIRHKKMWSFCPIFRLPAPKLQKLHLDTPGNPQIVPIGVPKMCAIISPLLF